MTPYDTHGLQHVASKACKNCGRTIEIFRKSGTRSYAQAAESTAEGLVLHQCDDPPYQVAPRQDDTSQHTCSYTHDGQQCPLRGTNSLGLSSKPTWYCLYHLEVLEQRVPQPTPEQHERWCAGACWEWYRETHPVPEGRLQLEKQYHLRGNLRQVFGRMLEGREWGDRPGRLLHVDWLRYRAGMTPTRREWATYLRELFERFNLPLSDELHEELMQLPPEGELVRKARMRALPDWAKWGIR